MCGRDDKWLGFTGDAIRQVAMLDPWLGERPELRDRLASRGRLAYAYLCGPAPEGSNRRPRRRVGASHDIDRPSGQRGHAVASAVLDVRDGQSCSEARRYRHYDGRRAAERWIKTGKSAEPTGTFVGTSSKRSVCATQSCR